MVARGDLGVEIPYIEVPVVQKYLIQKCRLLGKRVITATESFDAVSERNIIGNYNVIGIEDLTIKGLSRTSKNARNYVDTSWKNFVTILEEKLKRDQTIDYVPDIVVHLGGALIHKQIKLWLRRNEALKVYRLSDINPQANTFGHLTDSVSIPTLQALNALTKLPSKPHCHKQFIEQTDLILHRPFQIDIRHTHRKLARVRLCPCQQFLHFTL